jgi:ferritin
MATNVGKRTFDSINKQITEEIQSAYMFLSMAGVFSDMGLDGCAKWSKKQFNERIERGIKLHDHITMRGDKIKLLPIVAPKQDWRAPLHIFEEVLRLEQRTAVVLSAILDLATSDKDYVTNDFIGYMLKQQMEKESFAKFLLDRLRKMQSTELGVIMFDSELVNRIS